MSKTRRMSKIFAADGRSVTLALDGFGFSAKTAGVDHAARTVPAMAEHGLDNVLVTYGQAKNFAECFSDVGMCLRVDASTAVFDPSVPEASSLPASYSSRRWARWRGRFSAMTSAFESS